MDSRINLFQSFVYHCIAAEKKRKKGRKKIKEKRRKERIKEKKKKEESEF
jgi:hypothetical protein